ncbi:hypothetical protein RRG08_000363 [Elysia crispata]|uniref:Uncharacterized protein n=1 Tax=Elysia crispata TaxID=231223 RepID=A0AAE1BDV7_9GAST|nr:hypothetical protein RRG08_000363 [Elysia crispata]
MMSFTSFVIHGVRVDVVAVPPLAVNAGTHTTASRLSGVRVDVVAVPPLAVNAGTHTPPPLVFQESGWMLLLFHHLLLMQAHTPPPLVFQESGWMLLLFHHLLLMQAHTHHRLSSFRRVRVDVVAVPPLAVNAGTHTPPPLVFQESGWMLLLFHHLLLMQAHTHHRLSSFRVRGVRVDVVAVPPLAVNAGTHTPPPLVFQESGVRSERNTLKPPRLAQESGHESDSQVSVMHTYSSLSIFTEVTSA